ncbi:MAG: PASTA domain-containing protein [Melioribacteraceae bacterium]|nr:PASTA domain-containing protein [Melioribacteraceae bacterium]MCF8265073.1 PASTA domain-containing protein [Melioribacteraceae bacterium]MCF8413350.1 PASTA domain-containing protein [Melioribacteraceae bacterium]MCF8431959.1 PASTA domain-containing protein [Melioribacteraceae bacterium]
MKKLLLKMIKIGFYTIIPIIGFLVIMDLVVMPWLVSSPTTIVPNVVGMSKEQALNLIVESDLNPIEEGIKFDEKFKKGDIIFQKPEAGSEVKINRRIYIWVSGGEPLITMPELEGKSIRDAKITIEKYNLIVGEIESVRSEFPADIIVEQSVPKGDNVARGTEINLKVSVGPRVGMVRVPNLLGKSRKEAETILQRNSLAVGEIYFQRSNDLLPNTVISQIPSEDAIVKVGSTVDLTIIKFGSN